MAKRLTAAQMVEALQIATNETGWAVSPTGGGCDCLELELFDPWDLHETPRPIGWVRIAEVESAQVPTSWAADWVDVTVHRDGNVFAGGSWRFRNMSAAVNFLMDNGYLKA